MDWTHFHLMTNHMPVLGAIFGFLVLAWGVFRGSEDSKKVGLAVMIFTALIAIPVYLTGEPAEETVEDLPGVIHDLIEAHEDFAQFALISAIVSGVAALATFVFMRVRTSEGIARTLMFVTLILSGLTVGTMGWTANLGGVIRHSEIRAAGGPTGAAESEGRRPAKDDDDDDR